MKNELKDILPMQTFSAISQETSSSTTPTCSKPSSSVKTFASSSVPSSKVSSSAVNQPTGQSSSHDKPYKEAQKAPSQPKNASQQKMFRQRLLTMKKFLRPAFLTLRYRNLSIPRSQNREKRKTARHVEGKSLSKLVTRL